MSDSRFVHWVETLETVEREMASMFDNEPAIDEANPKAHVESAHRLLHGAVTQLKAADDD